MPEPIGRLLSLVDLETRSSLSRHTWRAWIRQRRLPHVRLGRRIFVREADYEAFVRAGLVPARKDA
jgi:excisionase family DNA binding protein